MSDGRDLDEWAEAQLDDYDYHVPEDQRFENDADDPHSVANRDGEDLSSVDPEAGDVIDLAAIPEEA